MMKILNKVFVTAGFALGTLAFSGEALAQEAPDVLVKRITQEVMEVAKNDQEIKAGNQKRIQALVETKILPHVDFKRATAMAAGRYWRDATSQQQRQLTDEFSALLIYTYAGAISKIGDQKVEFKPLAANTDDTEVVVRFQVQQPRGGEPVQVGYRLYKSPEGWKVYDVNLLGAWLIETYKGNFSTEIGKGGIDGLIHTLSEKNRSLAGQAGGSGRAF